MLRTLDTDTSCAPVYGEQEQRFFHGYYDQYCLLPLFVFRGGLAVVACGQVKERGQRFSCCCSFTPLSRLLLTASPPRHGRFLIQRVVSLQRFAPALLVL